MYLPQITNSLRKAGSKYTQIPNHIIYNSGISDGAFKTYAVLKSHKYGDNKVFPSIATLAKTRGKSKKTISTHLKELRDKGIIKSKRRGYSSSNLYNFPMEENFTNESDIKEENDSSLEKKTSSLSGRNLHPNKTNTNKTVLNNSEKTTGNGMERLRKTMYERGFKK